MKLQFVPIRVKGHQDRLSAAPLSCLEELNVIVDAAAKTLAYQIERSRHVQNTLELPSHQWQILLDDRVLKKKIREEIQDFVFGNKLKTLWIEKGWFSEATISIVDWPTLRQAVKRKPVHHQRWATKFLSGFYCCYHKLHQMGKHESNLCPRCGLFDETTDHIMFCQHHSSKESRSEAIQVLDRWLETSQTRWDIREMIIETLSTLQPTSSLFTHVPFNPYDADVLIAARRQDSIGIKNFWKASYVVTSAPSCFAIIRRLNLIAPHYHGRLACITSYSYSLGHSGTTAARWSMLVTLKVEK